MLCINFMGGRNFFFSLTPRFIYFLGQYVKNLYENYLHMESEMNGQMFSSLVFTSPFVRGNSILRCFLPKHNVWDNVFKGLCWLFESKGSVIFLLLFEIFFFLNNINFVDFYFILLLWILFFYSSSFFC